MKIRKLLAAAACAGAACCSLGTAHAVPVAMELALVIDVSGSVDASEYTLQRDGYEAAFNSASVGSAIESFAGSGGIAVGVYYFASNVMQLVGWTQLQSAADSAAFATTLGGLARPAIGDAAIGGGTLGTDTNIAEGVDRAVAGLTGNGFEGHRLVIDVSGDGKQGINRDGTVNCLEGTAACDAHADAARNAAAALGVIVNGLAIVDDVADLGTWYQDHVQTGPGSFVRTATFATFARAVEEKIGREVTGVPEPGSLALAGLALAVAARASRRRGTAA